MSYKTVSVAVKLPLAVAERLDTFARAREFPSRSAVILRACEFFLAAYTPRRIRAKDTRILDLERELRKLLNKAAAERRLLEGSSSSLTDEVKN